MGNPETPTGVVDGSVGSIVWVRRRNGSWWPGKILGPDDLSASHVMSPRSGTPVKLLGREDASVDWYNLEKSKRVKAFRCGEFDECIERAEASQGMPPKKREKYARREDAILHALELERQLLEKKYEKLGYSFNNRSNRLSNCVEQERVTSSEYSLHGNGEHLQSDSRKVSRSPSLTIQERNVGNHLYAERSEGNKLSGDYDNAGALPRMRGLQDFGLGAAPLKHKQSPSVDSNGSDKPILTSGTHHLSDVVLHRGDLVNVSGEHSLDQKERSQDISGEESLAKRRDRRRPLVQVLQNSATFPVSQSQQASGTVSIPGEEQHGVAYRAKKSRYTSPIIESGSCLNDQVIYPGHMDLSHSEHEESSSPHPADLYDENTCGSTEDTETDSSGTDSMESDTDDDTITLSEGAASIELQPKYPRLSETQVGHGSMSSEEVDDFSLEDDVVHPGNDNYVSTSAGVSKWQLKGKRNNRSLMKRSVDRNGTRRRYVGGGSFSGKTFEDLGRNDLSGFDVFDNNRMTQSRDMDGSRRNIFDLEDMPWREQPSKEYFIHSGEHSNLACANHRYNGGRMTLIDVDLKVQSRYQRQHVPLISLMSKLNGHAIVGHPVQIEVLENGTSESLLAAEDSFSSEALNHDSAVPSMWRTARRTATLRVPRPQPLSTAEADENAKIHQVFYQQRHAGNFGHSSGMTSGNSLPMVDKKLSRKPAKTMSLSSNQKIRTLSSIASQQKQSNDPKYGGHSCQVDGLIKPESLPTTVACIPVKLVFSRLHEELVGRHQQRPVQDGSKATQ